MCLAEYDATDLIKRIKQNIGLAAPEQVVLAKESDRLHKCRERALEINNDFRDSIAKRKEALNEHASAMSQIRVLLEVPENSSLSEDDANTRSSAIKDSLRILENAMESTEARHAEWKRRIEALRRELRFHKYRSEQNQLQNQLTTGLEHIHDRFRELVELESTTRTVKETLEQAFDEAIDKALPPLNDMMTNVFCRLTGQISFEKICVQRTKGQGGRTLQFRVGSERIPGQLFNPEDVLNGQANSALRLVPYFVFSHFQAEALKLDLLLIDDPSQSFDTSHVDFLLQELASAGSHAQLIVATHEDERFSPSLSKYFPRGEYNLIRFNEFKPKKGPSIVVA